MCVIIVAKVVWIGLTILIPHIEFSNIDDNAIGYSDQAFELSVRQSKVADCCHCHIPEMLIDSSSAQVELYAPVLQSILLIIRQQQPCSNFTFEDIEILISDGLAS